MPETKAPKPQRLTGKQQLFVAEYLKDLNIGKAYLRAGYKSNNADQDGWKLYQKPHVQAAIAEAQKERAKRTEIDQDYVLRGIQRTIERCEQAVPVLDSDGNPTGEYVFDAKSVLKGYELLGRHLGIFEKKDAPPPPPTLPSYYEVIFQQKILHQTVVVPPGAPAQQLPAAPVPPPLNRNQQILEKMRAEAKKLEN